jgi:hypothetical protein
VSRGEELEVVVRTEPKLTIYFRRPAITRLRPTPAQAEARLRMAEAMRIAKLLSAEEVAKLVGGEVVKVGDKVAIRMPDGRLLQKDMAFVGFYMRGWRSGRRRVAIPAWLEDVSKRFVALPLRAVEELARR